MKKVTYSILSLFFLIIFYFSSYIFWTEIGSYYWHTKSFEGHATIENEYRIIYLCDNSNPYVFQYQIYDKTIPILKKLDLENNEYMHIEGRGFTHREDNIDHLQLIEIHKIEPGISKKCLLTR